VISPVGRIKVALKAALRRRYGYAALRILRRGAAKAILDNLERSIGANPYVSQDVGAAYWSALQRLRKRFGGLDLSDERARP
jgi:hypothetical protein